MSADISAVRAGLAIVLLGLFISIGLGIAFGLSEDIFKGFIADGIAAHPLLHDDASADKIWRYAQRTHFHAGGIAAFCLGLIILVMFSNLPCHLKKVSAIFIGFGSVYPMAWLSMFFLAPSIGRKAAHDHLVTELFTFVGVGCLLLGSFVLVANLFFGCFSARTETASRTS